MVRMFPLEVFCLGVKNAMLFDRMTQQEDEIIQIMNFVESVKPIEACGLIAGCPSTAISPVTRSGA